MRTLGITAAMVGAALCLPAVAGADSPAARQAIQCGSVATANGGDARYLNTYRMSCDTARRIAKKARGGRYTAIDGKFTCTPKRSNGVTGLSYFCKNNGTTRSLGFLYYAP